MLQECVEYGEVKVTLSVINLLCAKNLPIQMD